MTVRDVVCGGDTEEEIAADENNIRKGLRHLTPAQRDGWELQKVVIKKLIGHRNE